ncbi:MAG: lactate utilization protein [Desulfobacterales bacterium]
MCPSHDLILQFKTKAEAVSATVHQVGSVREALAYAVDLCERKDACQLLASGCEAPLSHAATDLCEAKQKKWIAAPGLPAEEGGFLESACGERGIGVVKDSLRNHTAGIDIGFTVADYGIAETGSLVIESSSEAVRLATMISEIHVAAIAAGRIRPTAMDLEPELREMMAEAPSYTAFITGASRTADIERVLALGVHGPLELHILIVEDR